jgi:lipopolysaccharide transport system ATP-binding protein
MSDTVIRVENLSKRYVLSHQQEGGYKALRDVIADGAKSLLKPLQGSKKDHPSAKEEFWALKDVSFEIQQGDRIGIIGRNGAGKSTLLKILSRIVEPTSGNIRIRGRVASLLEVGTGFHPELTGRENVFLNGAILGMSRAEIQRKFDEIVAFAEVEKFLDTPVKRYSSGMYVRLAFAVAAHLEPEILIVDEVLAVGDNAFQKKCLGKMGEVAREGRTVIFVSHSMEAVTTLCDKAVYLARGQVQTVGKSNEVVTTYLTELTDNTNKDLERLRMPGLGNSIQFSDLKLLTEKESFLFFGQPIEIEMKITSNSTLNDLVVGTSIFDAIGTCVGSYISDHFSTKDGQNLVISQTIHNLCLAPGSYYINFGIAQGQRDSLRLLDAIIGTSNFQVLPLKFNQESSVLWDGNWGRVVFHDVDHEIIYK